MNKQKLTVGSRGSKLALVQIEEITSLLQQKGVILPFDVVTYVTQGDVDQSTSLREDIADNFFTDTLDQALLDNEIDIAIHSAKDLPQNLHESLEIFALTKSIDESDAFVGNSKFQDLKKGSKIGTSSTLRKKCIEELNPSLKTVDIRGNIEERLVLLKEGKVDGLIVATAAMKRLGLEELITQIMPWDGYPFQGQLAVVGRSADQELRSLFEAIDVRKTYGKVSLVGAGPGDPELITLKAVKTLNSADCVFYDYLVHKSLLDHAKKAEKIYVGKRKGEHTLRQSDLSKMLKQKAMAGKHVVRLKGGDPLVFGRGADEIEYLRAFHIEVEVIAGLSSAIAIPSNLGIPLTARGISSSVAFTSGHSENESKTNLKPIKIPDVDTLVVFMGLTKLPQLCQSLNKAKWKKETPIIIISKGTRIDEKIICGTLQDINNKLKDSHLEPPALIIVGEVVQFYRGKKKKSESILYTGTNPEKYEELGHIIHWPMIEICEAAIDEQTGKDLIDKMPTFDIILLTSRIAVQYFMHLVKTHNISMDMILEKDVVVIGKDTATQLIEFDINPKFIAETETSEGLLQVLKVNYDLSRKNILFPRSSLSNPFLKEELKKCGSKIMELTVYENKKPKKRDLPKEPIQKIIFTSPSTVHNFLEDYGSIPKEWEIISKGPLTSKALKEAGYSCEVLIYG